MGKVKEERVEKAGMCVSGGQSWSWLWLAGKGRPTSDSWLLAPAGGQRESRSVEHSEGKYLKGREC